MKPLVLAAIAAALVFPAHAEKRNPRKVAVFIGGDPDGTLDEHSKEFFEKAAVHARALKYETIEALSITGKGDSKFDRATVGRSLATLKEQVRSKHLEPGDQVVIQVFTHGSPKGEGETAHTVGSKYFDLPMSDLAKWRDELEKGGIKLAIIDNSCYGGNSLDLATKKTCVISAADRDSVAIVKSGSEIFSSGLWKTGRANAGSSLEDIYLKTRLQGESSTETFRETPSISTAADSKTREAMGEEYNLEDVARVNESRFRRKGSPECAESDESEKLANEIEKLAKGIEESTTVDQSANLKEFLTLQGKIAGQRLYNRREINRVWKEAGAREALGNCFNLNAFTCWNEQGSIAYVYPVASGYPKSCESQRDLFLKVCKDPDALKLYRSYQKLEQSADYDRLQKLESKLMHAEAKTYDSIYRKQANAADEPCRDFKF